MSANSGGGDGLIIFVMILDLMGIVDDANYQPGGGGVLPKSLGRGVRPASQDPYPIYDQNLRFSLSHYDLLMA